MVDGATAARQPLIMSMKVKDILKIKRRFLRKLRPEMEGDRETWELFRDHPCRRTRRHEHVPSPSTGATVLIDRHYNPLKPYRRGESNMYAVARNGDCTVKYVEVAGNHLVLRPHNDAYPV
jgi:hypothetical protein